VVVLGIKGDHQPALQLLQSQPFVREVNFENEALRLYVDQGESSLPVILRLLDGAHIELRTISLSRPSLDDVFLRQTGHSLREEAA
ncbi:MAG: DUF4162 domain-containing protein, partial [Candidatus Dormibacteraceae bacterium]